MEQASVKILYNNVDITNDISTSLVDFSYQDKTSGESDEINISLHNREGLWGLEWYPEKGAELTAQILHGTGILDCGKFYIDELKLSGSKSNGDTVTVKGLGAGIKDGTRTINNHANENKTLAQIAKGIAAKYGWTVQGTVPEITVGRITQHRETDLHFLSRIAAQFGIIFSVRGTVITFANIFDVEGAANAATFTKSDLSSWDINDKTLHIYLEAVSEHYNTKTKRLVTFKTPAGKVIDYTTVTTGNYLNIKERAENEQQAELISRSSIYRTNSLQQEGTVNIPGNIVVVAGVNITIQELGNFSGNYHVTGSTHAVSKSNGYTTAMEIKRVGVLAYELQKNKDSEEQQTTAADSEPGGTYTPPVQKQPIGPRQQRLLDGPKYDYLKFITTGDSGG